MLFSFFYSTFKGKKKASLHIKEKTEKPLKIQIFRNSLQYFLNSNERPCSYIPLNTIKLSVFIVNW